MDRFEVKMQHDEDSLIALSHMQYDLFCTRNRIARTLICVVFVVLGLQYIPNWWAYLFIAYGCYLITNTYASANHTARKLAAQLKEANMPFPCSQYLFGKSSLRILSLPDGEELEPLPYSQVRRLGEDMRNFYIFRDQYGGYLIPKSQLAGREGEFRKFIEEKTGMSFRRRKAPIRRLMDWVKKRENEPEHL